MKRRLGPRLRMLGLSAVDHDLFRLNLRTLKGEPELYAFK